MDIVFDPQKNIRNILNRGISFTSAALFQWEIAIIWQDTRKTYSENRYIALGFIQERLHALVFCDISDGVRIISLRKANKREVSFYERQTTQP